MLSVTIIAVGRLKERFWVDACAEYLKRLRPYAHVVVDEVPDLDPARVGGEASAREREGQEILSRVPERAYVVALAIDGKQRSSEQFSAHLSDLALDGHSDIVFIIGGSTGLDPAVLARANESLSFGSITLPHNLARVVLLEQVYRAFRIARGEPYHK